MTNKYYIDVMYIAVSFINTNRIVTSSYWINYCPPKDNESTTDDP